MSGMMRLTTYGAALPWTSGGDLISLAFKWMPGR